MRFLLSLPILSILIFSLSCKTTTENQTQVSSSVQQEKEESQEKPQSIVVPVASLGDVSETRKKILQNSLEDELKEHFTIISQERFEEAQEKAFEQLDYEECTEDQCIMMIQEMLQVENVFHLEVIGEGTDTQLSLSWRTLDEKKKEEHFCENCDTGQLRKLIGGLVTNITGIVVKNDFDTRQNNFNNLDIFAGFNDLTIYEEKNTPEGYDKDHFYLDLQINIGRMKSKNFDYKNKKFRIAISRYREISPNRIELQFPIQDFDINYLDKIQGCAKKDNREWMLNKHGSSSYWFSIVLSQRMLNLANTSKCFIDSFNIYDQDYIRNIFLNLEKIFNSAYKNNKIIIWDHSVISDRKYWSKLDKNTEADFWKHWIKLIQKNSKLIYY